MNTRAFSPNLQDKIDLLKSKREPVKLGSINFDSPLLLAPMAAICTRPFRLLMEDLGAGGTVSELISCHGINHGNERTLEMLKIDENEKNIGIQLFGEDPESMAQAAQVAEKYGPKFIDINMGCPVRKVVTKGGGSALLKEIESLGPFFKKVKSAISIPLSIKIRTGWEAEAINADKIEYIARNEGIEWVAIHGRTRAQQYTGKADWEYIEWLAQNTKLPIIGNGDLHSSPQVKKRMEQTHCDSLMIARGCLRNPFIFLEPYIGNENIAFTGEDYWEVIQRLFDYTNKSYEKERTRLIQMRKLNVWFSAGFKGAAKYRSAMFSCKTLDECMQESQDYFLGLTGKSKYLNLEETFMTSGHG